MKKLYFFILILFTAFIGNTAFAQDTSEEDPYADYSYLWENKKDKKKSKKKKKDKVEKQYDSRQTIDEDPEQISIKEDVTAPEETELFNTSEATYADTLKEDSQPKQIPSDTLKKEEAPAEELFPSDTTRKESVTPSDTLKQIEEVPTDTLKKEVPQEEISTEPEQEEPKEEEQAKEPKEKKKKSAAPPMGDFRSGMTQTGSNSFDGGLTVTQIGGQYYAGMILNPEFNLGKVGVGLNVPILYGLQDHKVRTQIFKDGVGAARLITYMRMGIQKETPVYFKVGQLNNTMIGFGGLINNYTNTTSYEKRKVGLHYDVNYKGFAGIEGMYSDFTPGSFNLMAIRPYVRPMAFTGIPIVNTFEIGATIVHDKDQTKQITSDSTYTTYGLTKNGVGAFGFDAGVTLLRVPFIQINLYGTYNHLNATSQALRDSLKSAYPAQSLSTEIKNGTGGSVGVNFRFNFIANVFNTDVRIERLKYSDYYLPQFFDATYEINKDAKIYSLANAKKMSGIYGSLSGQILKKVRLGGNLMIPDQITPSTPARVQVNADVDRLADKISLHGSYIKGNLTTLTDAFTLDQRSLLKLQVAYHLNKFLVTGLNYYWAFTPTADGGYKANKFVSPYFGFSMQF